MKFFRLCALFVLVWVAPAWAAKEFTLPTPSRAQTYPAHDQHSTENVAIAVDLYDMGAKAEIFKVNWRENGYLPVYLVVTNDGDQPIALTDMKIDWVTGNRSKIEPATDDDLARRVGRVKHRGDEPSRNPFPVPLPKKGPQVGLSKEARQEIEAAQFRALAVEPHSTRAGFLFFDVQGIREPVAGAHVYVSGVKDSSGQELMYFEIPMDKYLSAAPAR
jgi:hypothetical protein